MSFVRFARIALAVVFTAACIPARPAEAQAALPPSTATPSEQLYTVLIYERPADLANRTSKSKSDAYWSSYDSFAAALMKAGALRGGSALDEQVTITVRGAGSADAAVTGARLGGYFVIAAPTRAAAEALAKLAPPAALAVELRPHRPNPHAANMAGK